MTTGDEKGTSERRDEGTKGSEGGLGFRLLALADLRGASEAADDTPQRVDKANFDAVMAGFAPRARFKVPDHLAGGRSPLDIDLTFRSMRDFHPVAVLEQAASLRPHLAVCRILASVAKGEIGGPDALRKLEAERVPDELRRAVEAALAAQPEKAQKHEGTGAGREDSGGQGDLLSSVGMPAESSTGVQGAVASLIDRMGIPSKQIAAQPQRRAAANLLDGLARRLHTQLDAVLHDPALEAVESTWRGCQMLISRADFQETPLAVYLAHCRRDGLPDALRRSLVRVSGGDDDGVDAVLADFAFDQTAGDLALLRAAAQVAEEQYCPLMAAASPRLLGVEGNDYSSLPRSLQARFDAPDLIEWRDLRRTDAAGYVALVLPDVVARFPYGARTVPIPELGYEEGGGLVWTRGVWPVGAAMFASVARAGWCIAFSGTQDGCVENMPIGPVRVRGSDTHVAAQTVWTDDQLTELARAGLVVLSARPNQNKVYVMSAPMLYDPPPAADAAEAREARLHATLPYCLFAQRIARRLARTQDRIAAGTGDADVERMLLESLGSLFRKPGCVRAEVSHSDDEADVREAFVQILPNFTILGRDVNLILDFQLLR